MDRPQATLRNGNYPIIQIQCQKGECTINLTVIEVSIYSTRLAALHVGGETLKIPLAPIGGQIWIRYFIINDNNLCILLDAMELRRLN